MPTGWSGWSGGALFIPSYEGVANQLFNMT